MRLLSCGLGKRGLPAIARGDLGSASIEFAASALVMCTAMIGMMNMCQAIYAYHYTAEAAREGARYAMVRGSECTGFSSNCPVTSAEVQTYVQDLDYPGIIPSKMLVTTTWAAFPTGVTCTPSATCNNPGDLVKVVASYSYPLTIPTLGTRTLTFTSTSEMVISQ